MADETRRDVGILRAEFEDKLAQFRVMMLAEIRAQNDHQDQEFNKGLRALREDFAEGIAAIRNDLRSFVTNDVFIARLSPVQAIAYGLVALLMSLMSGLLAMGLWAGTK